MTSAQIDNKNLLNQIIKYIPVISSWAPLKKTAQAVFFIFGLSALRSSPEPDSKWNNGPLRTMTDEISAEKVYLLCSEQYLPEKDNLVEWGSQRL